MWGSLLLSEVLEIEESCEEKKEEEGRICVGEREGMEGIFVTSPKTFS